MTKYNFIKKLSWNNNFSRIMCLIIGLVPNIIVLYFLIKNFHINLLIAEIIVALLIFIYYKFSIFDWDLYITDDKIILKRWIKKEVILDKSAVKLDAINWGMTTNFNVFKVLISNQKFTVQLRLKNIEKLNMPKLIDRLEKKINEEIDLH